MDRLGLASVSGVVFPMSVYVRYPCPNCHRHLSLRLEYVNRRVVCNYCKQPFLSRARVRVPASASIELTQAIAGINRAPAFESAKVGAVEERESAPVMELSVLGHGPGVGRDGEDAGEATTLNARVAELEHALSRAEVRSTRRFEQAKAIWARERRALEQDFDRVSVRYNRQLDEERAWQVKRRRVLQGQRDAALVHAEAMVAAQQEAADRATRLEGECDRLRLVVEDLEQTLDSLRHQYAEESHAWREELRRELASAAERRESEAEHSSKRLQAVVAQLEDSLGQLEAARRELELVREVKPIEIEATLESTLPLETAFLPPGRNLDFVLAETERLEREIERGRAERAAEAQRYEALVERTVHLEAELERTRVAYEAEAQARRLAVEELHLRLNYRPQVDRGDAMTLTEEPAADREGGDGVMRLDQFAPSEQEASAPASPTPPTSPSSASPDERIAALRLYLRKAQEAEEERQSKRFISRLARAWRPGNSR